MARITGGGTEEMRALAVRLRTADPQLKSGLRKRFRNAAGPVVAKVKASIAAEPSHHDGTLRGEIARTVSSSVGVSSTGVRLDIVSMGSKMPEGKDTLPKHTDSRSGWGHPVYARPGRARTWTRQHGKTQWFEEPIGSCARQLQAAAQAAMDETRRHLS